MNRVNRRRTLAGALGMLIIAAAAVVGTEPGVAQQKPDLFTEIYKRGSAKQKVMKTLRGRFVETTTSTLLTKPIVARGTVIAAAPSRVRMTYAEPEAKTLTMDGKTLTIVWAGRNERQQINVTDIQKRIDQYFTTASVKDLQSMFEIAARPDATMRDHDLVEMTPKRKQISQGLARLEIWIDRTSDLLTQMRMTFPSGVQKTIALDDLEINVPVTDAMFTQ